MNVKEIDMADDCEAIKNARLPHELRIPRSSAGMGKKKDVIDINSTMELLEAQIGRATLAMVHRDEAAYIAAWQSAMDTLDNKSSITSDSPIAEIIDDPKLVTLLEKKFNAIFIKQLNGLTEKDFLAVSRAGKRSWKKIQDILQKLNLSH